MGEAESIYQLEALCTFTRGVTFSKKDQLPDDRGIGILRSHNVVFEDNKVSLHNLMYVKDTVRVKDEQRLKKDDLLISISNSKEQTGKLGISPNDTDLYIGGFMAIIRAEPLINPYFLFLNLSTKRFKSFISGRNQGTTNIWNITFNRIKDFEIPLPPLGEQKRIAALFQSIDAAIEQAEEQEKNLVALCTKLATELVCIDAQFGNLLHSKNCKPSTLGQIAKETRENSKTPLEEGIVRFVGLEHIESGKLSIQGWGNVADGTTFTKVFQVGDVLFGRRRAYLKKAAQADFKGLCSGDITVLRANEKLILPDLLPYYLSADPVFDFAVSNSAGSLSPRAKWRDLSKYEITLPDLTTQEKILEVFKLLDKNINENRAQFSTLKKLKQKLLDEILG